MKKLILISILFYSTTIIAQNTEINAQVYKWQEIKSKNDAVSNQNIIFQGGTRDLKELIVTGHQMHAGATQNQNDYYKGYEHLVIVKEGELDVKILDKHKTLGPGSIAMIMPYDQFSLSNNHDKDVYFYVFNYHSKTPVDEERGAKAGGSFTIDWDDLTFKEHDKGGVRQYFSRPTAMCEYFDIHVTTLNAGLKSHEPHTHRAAEIVLMLDGETEMLIGNNHYKGSKGDVYFITSEIPHSIQNVGSQPAMYFAIQWQ